MSVSAKIKQYGAMRAVGMDTRQITKMIAAEAATHYSYAVWNFPAIPLTVILVFVLAATMIAVHTPVKRIKNMAVTDIMNEM